MTLVALVRKIGER